MLSSTTLCAPALELRAGSTSIPAASCIIFPAAKFALAKPLLRLLGSACSGDLECDEARHATGEDGGPSIGIVRIDPSCDAIRCQPGPPPLEMSLSSGEGDRAGLPILELVLASGESDEDTKRIGGDT
jgi:hypothetical protein